MSLESLQPGLSAEVSTTVRTDNTAARIVDGAVSMFSTPSMIGLMEHAAWDAVAEHLAAGETTVGTAVDIKHLAASPIGLEVTARAELVEVVGRRLRFKVEARDPHEPIGEGWHERFIVDLDRFTVRAEQKVKSAPGVDIG
ncbi:MAG: thioesterase family protein [Chloroflexota bacterium]